MLTTGCHLNFDLLLPCFLLRFHVLLVDKIQSTELLVGRDNTAGLGSLCDAYITAGLESLYTYTRSDNEIFKIIAIKCLYFLLNTVVVSFKVILEDYR